MFANLSRPCSGFINTMVHANGKHSFEKEVLQQQQRWVVIFVCVSNVCRSPMAEYLFRNLVTKNSAAATAVGVRSRSLSTQYEPVGSPASANGVKVMQDCYGGIDMSSHRSALLSEQV